MIDPANRKLEAERDNARASELRLARKLDRSGTDWDFVVGCMAFAYAIGFLVGALIW